MVESSAPPANRQKALSFGEDKKMASTLSVGSASSPQKPRQKGGTDSLSVPGAFAEDSNTPRSIRSMRSASSMTCADGTKGPKQSTSSVVLLAAPQNSQNGGGSSESSRATSSSRKRDRKKDPPVNDGNKTIIKDVFGVYQQAQRLVETIANVWRWSHDANTAYRQKLPGLSRIHIGKETYVVRSCVLIGTPSLMPAAGGTGFSLSHTSVTDPSLQEVYCQHVSPYFPHILTLLKLRWILRLHSACCELDYKLCSLRQLINGLQYNIIQQFAEAQSDSVFSKKVQNSAGSHLNLNSVMDDFMDQLQRAMGASWRAFLEYVQSCDPSRSVFASRMDLADPQVVGNDTLAQCIDSIFVANFLRTPRVVTGPTRLKELYDDLELFQIPVPELPPLPSKGGFQNLKNWIVAQMRPTMKNREKGLKRDGDKSAQLDLVYLTAYVELHDGMVLAGPGDAMPTDPIEPPPIPTEGPDCTAALAQLNESGGGDQTYEMEKSKQYYLPRIKKEYFNMAAQAIHHHMTFPEGIRERLYALLYEEYGLTMKERERLAIATTQNVDGPRLDQMELWNMEDNEKMRLRHWESVYHKDTTYLQQSSLVCPPIEFGKLPRFTHEAPVHMRTALGSAYGSLDMTRSLPNLRSLTAKCGNRPPFEVPLITGPLTMDPDLKKLRTTGFFIKMPPLK